MKSIHPRFITDHKGKKLSVVLSFNEYNMLLKNWENSGKIQPRKKVKEEKEPTKKEILEDIKQAVKEVKLARAGKLKLKSAEELLKELS
ncbi:hypothetical protein ACSYG2_02550 [Leptospira interrogans serovar Icterohaemorrhagiae]|uniref:hypothetical protein n=2 Tax=Leptospira interrogans TaxID=173 RepID=UPI0009E24975|nr:hypothetical protein [Leptospira interrogans]QOI33241.1 hypothetical protein LeptoLang_02675 [Leptospira interrogans serovar Icterohaemorrhagiae]QOI35559.1 hypothetical protein LeptoLang_15935 [Leptospira interrogans serovar Icterohaemorrhagiae]